MDQLVAVDGEEVNSCTHEQVVDKIRQLGNQCCLLVVDAETDKMYKMVSLLSFNVIFILVQIFYKSSSLNSVYLHDMTWPLFTFFYVEHQ